MQSLHQRRRAVAGDDAVVADLAAALAVERRAVEDDAAFLARVEPPGHLAVLQHGQDLGVLDLE